MGLNRPLPVRYGEWIQNFVAGDMGTSYSYQIPVKELIADKIPITAAMTLMSFIGILLLSVPLGILCVRFENRMVDKISLVLNQIMMSVPPFFIGMLLTVVFGLFFHMFTPGEYISYTEDIGGFLGYLVLPSLAIALPKAAMTMKMLRSSMLSQMGQEYVRTARSRGNSPWRILPVSYTHLDVYKRQAWRKSAYPYRRDGSFKERNSLRFHDHQYRSNAAWRYVYFLCASRISGSSVCGGDRFFDRGL